MNVLSKNWLFKNKFSFNYKTPTLLSWCFVFLSFFSKGQVNLVSNPSFENLSSCIITGNSIKLATGWDTLLAGGGGGPEIFNSCINPDPLFGVPINIFGISYQIPKSGQSYSMMGWYLNSTSVSREYIQTKLIQPLVIGKTYCVSYYVSLTNRSQFSIDELGAYFDNGTIYAPYYAPAVVTPQVKSPSGFFYSDTLNWMKVEGLYTATANYDYLTIGNFKSQASTTYTLAYPSSSGILAEYYIDDVSVVETNSKANASADTLICIGDSTFIGTNEEALNCQWFSNNLQIAQGAGIWVKPTTNQQYFIKQDVCGNISYDTVKVSIKDVNCNPVINSEIPNTFTPNGDGINDTWHFNLGSNVILNEFSVYNRWGNLIKKTEIVNSNYILWDGKTTSGESCSDGVYFYFIKYTDSKGDIKNKKGNISLFR